MEEHRRILGPKSSANDRNHLSQLRILKISRIVEKAQVAYLIVRPVLPK
jgi:hypothetical protein